MSKPRKSSAALPIIALSGAMLAGLLLWQRQAPRGVPGSTAASGHGEPPVTHPLAEKSRGEPSHGPAAEGQTDGGVQLGYGQPDPATLPEWMKDPASLQETMRAERMASRKESRGEQLARLAAHRPATIGKAESQMLDFYGQVVRTFDTHSHSCNQLAEALGSLVEQGQAPADALAESRAGMDVEGQAQAQAELEDAAAEELELLRAALRSGVARCAQEPKVMGAMRSLAAMAHRT